MSASTVINSTEPAGSSAPPAGRLPWWRREPLSIVELADALHVAKFGRRGFDPGRSIARMVELNATAAHVFPLGCHLDGNVLLFRHHSPGDPPPAFDYLQEWLDLSRPVGLRTVVYFNVHSVKAHHARRHPDWQQRRIDGSAKENVYNVESSFCVNSPWRNWVLDRLRELCAYPIDGIFFDGPVVFDDCCYCEHCRRSFREQFGSQMPPTDALDHEAFPALVEFRSGSLANFVRDSRNVIREFGDELLFYVNANPLYPSRIHARDNRKLAEHVDILASEGGFLGGDLMRENPLWKVSLNAKLLEAQASAAGVPHLVFDCLTHTPWTSYSLPAAEATLLWASSVAHGAGTWMSCYRDAMDRPGLRAIGSLYQFARQHTRELFDTRSLADVAILVSDATLNHYRGADVPQTDLAVERRNIAAGNVTHELYGWYSALWSSQVPLDLIDDRCIVDGILDRYRLIILPNSACLSDSCAQKLLEFVRRGGNLIASFETGLYDERGRRRSRGALDEAFGVTRAGVGISPPRQWDYLFDHTRPYRDSPLELCVPSPTCALSVRTDPQAQVLMTFSAPLADRYVDLAEDSGQAAVVRHHFGQGQCVYFACDFGAALRAWRIPEHLALVRDLVWQLARPRLRIDGASPCLEVSLRATRDGRSVLLHLVNYDGGMTRPMQRVLPLHDLTIGVRELGGIRAAETLRNPRRLSVAADEPWTTIQLPRLDEYEVVRFILETEQKPLELG